MALEKVDAGALDELLGIFTSITPVKDHSSQEPNDQIKVTKFAIEEVEEVK